MGWKEDVKYRMRTFALFNMLRVALWKAENEERIRETRREEGKMAGTSFLTGRWVKTE